MKTLSSTVTGDGPEILLVHGGMTDGALAWSSQAPLAERWTLRIVDRAGYGRSAHFSAGEDIALDARLLAEALESPVHLVGHSSGAIAVMLLAAAAPSLVRSLTIVEPPSYRFIDDPDVRSLADAGDALWDATGMSDREWLIRFFVVFGEDPPPEGTLTMLDTHVPAFRRFVRRPWQIELPVDDLAAATFPRLVVSGGHDSAFERLNDALALAIRSERAVVAGAGHEVQMTGAHFNGVLERFLDASAESS